MHSKPVLQWFGRGVSLVVLFGAPLGCSDDGDGSASATSESESTTTAAPTPDRTIEFDAIDFGYEQLDLSGIIAGQTVRFVMVNSGAEPHEFEVLDSEGAALGEVEKTAVGETGEATVTFEAPGQYSYQCILEHEATGESHDVLGMVGTFEVAAA